MAKTAAKSSSRRASAKSPKKATARSTKSGSAAAASKSRAAADSAAQDEVTIDRRRDERRDEADAAPAGAAQLGERRKKVNRRRQIDPTTCERDYTDQEVEFMNALDDYKRKSGRMFPTCSEVLEVLRGLGYVKLSASELGAMTADVSSCASAKPMPSDWAMDAESCEDASETVGKLQPVC